MPEAVLASGFIYLTKILFKVGKSLEKVEVILFSLLNFINLWKCSQRFGFFFNKNNFKLFIINYDVIF